MKSRYLGNCLSIEVLYQNPPIIVIGSPSSISDELPHKAKRATTWPHTCQDRAATNVQQRADVVDMQLRRKSSHDFIEPFLNPQLLLTAMFIKPIFSSHVHFIAGVHAPTARFLLRHRVTGLRNGEHGEHVLHAIGCNCRKTMGCRSLQISGHGRSYH